MKNIKKVLIFVLFVFASVLALNLSVKAADQIGAEADFTTLAAKHNSYTDAWTYGDWTVSGGANNDGKWNYIKIGGKSENLGKYSDYYIASPKVDGAATKVTVNIIDGSLPQAGMGVTSWGVYVYSDANMTNQVDYVAGGTITKSAQLFTFTPSTGTTWPTNSYFKVKFVLTNTSTKNGIIWLDNVKVYEEVNGNAVTLSAPTATLSGKTVSWGAVENAEKYEITLYNSVYNITEKYETTNTSYTCAVSKSGNYEVTVAAIGDGMNYLNSANAKAGEFKVEFTKKSIKDFLALEDDATKGVESDYYLLTGKITNIANTQYGNFTLEAIDGSGNSIYVYGLSKTITQKTDQQFGTLRLTEGSLVAIAGYKSSYNGNPQVGGAVYLGEPELTALEQVALSDTKTSMIVNYQVNKDVIYSYEFEKAEFKLVDEVMVETAKLKDITWTGNTATYYGFSSEKGMQIGSSKAAIATYTLTSTETFSNVKNIYLNLSGASKTDAKVTVTVGGKQIGETVSLTTTASIYEFVSNEALNGAVVIKYEQTASAAVYIKSIEVTSGAPTYNMISSSIRFGAKISKDLYDELATKGATWGVEIKAGQGNAKTYACTPVRVNENGVEDANGEFYQFALVINGIKYDNIDLELAAKAYVDVDGTKTYLDEATYSLRTLVDTYLAANDKSAYEDHLGVLNHLSSYGK